MIKTETGDDNERILENLYNDLKTVLIRQDGTLAETESRRGDLVKIGKRFMDRYSADSIEEMFDAYDATVVHVLQDAGIISNGRLQ